jgi:DNA replication protein DnaC
MNLQHQLETQLKTLRLGGFLQTLDLRLQEAQKASVGYVEFLQLLVQDEIERREAKKLTLRLSRASFEEEKTLEGFDYSFNPKLNAKLIRDLGNATFIERKEHVLLYGPAGVEKAISFRPWDIKPAVWAMRSSLPRPLNSSVFFLRDAPIIPGKKG